MMGGMNGGAPGAIASPMGGMEGMMQNPEVMMQMMQNPMVQQMMQNISQNPQMLQAMMQNNPMIQQMTQSNPMLQQMFSNPQFLQTMMNPQVMQGMLQMQQAMGGMGAAGAQQTPALTGSPDAAPPVAAPMMNPMQMMQMMQGMPGMAGGMPGQTDTRPAEERFSVQVTQLENMGFPDKHSNLQALSQTNGDVNEAINALIGGA